MNVALYARVSKADVEEQDPENQLIRLRESAKGHLVVAEFVDRISGARDNRPALDDMRKLIRQRKIDLVIAVRLDRMGRSTIHLLELFKEFSQFGVEFRALDQPIDTGTVMGRLVLTILAAVAEMERELIRERTRDGLARAAKEGRVPGRHPKGCGVDFPCPKGVKHARKKGGVVVQEGDGSFSAPSANDRLFEPSEPRSNENRVPSPTGVADSRLHPQKAGGRDGSG